MDLDILFLGKLFPKEKAAEIKSKMRTGMQEAANALQWNIIDGLDGNSCGTVRILDYLPIDSYPNGYADKTIDEYVFSHTDKYDSQDKIVKATNMRIVKQFANLPAFKREVSAWAKDGSGRKKVIISYTASSMFLELLKYAKKLNKDIESVCIIADLPEFVSARKLSGIKKLYCAYQTKKSASLYKHVDKFVLLTEHMAERLGIKAPYMVMEGIATEPDVECDSSLYDKYKGEKYVFYAGTLNFTFGIGTLLEAFALVPDRGIKLVICGFGEAEERIREMQKDDDRIVFLGRVDREKVIPLQRGATLLVNPRQNNEEFTKYSFPSKTLEYLSSGAVMLAYKLLGIPDEYDEYINYAEDNSPETLAAEISRICSLSDEERKESGLRAREFVLNNKNNTEQMRRVLEFLGK